VRPAKRHHHHLFLGQDHRPATTTRQLQLGTSFFPIRIGAAIGYSDSSLRTGVAGAKYPAAADNPFTLVESCFENQEERADRQLRKVNVRVGMVPQRDSNPCFSLERAATRLLPRRLGVCPLPGRWLADAGMNQIEMRRRKRFGAPGPSGCRHDLCALAPRREGRSPHICPASAQTQVTTEIR
jgi:hypothetical protein